MKNKYHHDRWADRHVIHMEPEVMDKFSADDSLFSCQATDRNQVVADALDTLPNKRYQQLLDGLYRRHLSPQMMAAEMEVTLPNFYNLHRRALAALKAHMPAQKEE